MWLIPHLLRFITTSFLLWIGLTTIIPQTLSKYTNPEIRANEFMSTNYPYNSITLSMSPNNSQPIVNTTVYYIIGHPDDEVMFFSPSLLELAKPQYGNTLKLICFSAGDSISTMGPIRSQELYHSAQILGITPENVEILNFKDGMNISWDSGDIGVHLKKLISEPAATLITFDEEGVSNHQNHISLYHGVKKFYDTEKHKQSLAMYKLKSLNMWEKYSFTLLTNVEILVNNLSKLFSHLLLSFLLKLNVKLNVNISFFNFHVDNTLKFYSDLNMLSTSYAAMAYGHYSQMVWFRYGWLMFSRYLMFNSLLYVQ